MDIIAAQPEYTRTMLISAYNIISNNELWTTLKEINPGEVGYAWTENNLIKKIKDLIVNADPSHSGGSLVSTLLIMKKIADKK